MFAGKMDCYVNNERIIFFCNFLQLKEAIKAMIPSTHNSNLCIRIRQNLGKYSETIIVGSRLTTFDKISFFQASEQ